jgi:UTP---glucose-1-phosphate uridylyltransferase
MALDTFVTEACRLLGKEIDRLIVLVENLKSAKTQAEKIDILNAEPKVVSFLQQPSFARSFLSGLSLDCELVMKSVMAIGQAEYLLDTKSVPAGEEVERARKLIEALLPVEYFYEEIGGIVGYHLTMIQFLCRPERRFETAKAKYHSPTGIDITRLSSEVCDSIYWAIERMEEVCEIYPVGGAADRLRLYDPETAMALPAAKLSFQGRTLLARLIDDLQAREYLYYKLKGKQLTLPVAMMTSHEKNNHDQIVDVFESHQWFHRERERFAFFCQPLVPTINKDGCWATIGPMQLLLKPGGHGVIWKLARDQKVISWFFEQGAKKAIVRQINNPVSSEDKGLLAFFGYGLKENKEFGFASCPRQVKASEGVNVIVEEEKGGHFEYTLTNIEYCDFNKYGIIDEPAEPGGLYSKYPSNTNLLFVDLSAILSALEGCPIPGMLVNLKKIAYRDAQNEPREQELARLESTMQNIADCFRFRSLTPFDPTKATQLSTYITFNERRKTISTTKKEYCVGASMLETPEGCFLDVLHNARELLEHYCQFEVPSLESIRENFSSPTFLFSYHPSLGPLYEVIGQKIRKGKLSMKSECRLFLSECDLENVEIEGSLCIEAENIMGHLDARNILLYSERTGKCTLQNVKVRNRGIDFEGPNVFWKNEICRRECCHILLEGNGEFYAEDVVLEGDMKIHVPNGYKVTATQKGGHVVLEKEKIESPTWHWRYFFTKDKQIALDKKKNG